MFGSIGMPELVIILVIALIIFGPRKLPELGRSLGKSLGEFKKASNELQRTLEEEIRVEEVRDRKVASKSEQDSAISAAIIPIPDTIGAGPVVTPPAEVAQSFTPPLTEDEDPPEDGPVSRTPTGTGPTA